MANQDDSRERREGVDETSIHVEDKRRFDPSTGEPRPASGTVPLPGGGVMQGGAAEPPETQLPVTFADLVNPFMLIGLVGLGVLPAPESGRSEISLASAHAAIELLELLHARTEGNRLPDETRVLEQALYQLKLQYVEVRERTRRG